MFHSALITIALSLTRSYDFKLTVFTTTEPFITKSVINNTEVYHTTIALDVLQSKAHHQGNEKE